MATIKLLMNKPYSHFQRRTTHTLVKAITYTQNGEPSQ